MIYTFTCASSQQGLDALLQLTSPQGDPFSQDWVVCPHPESARWVSQQIALARGVRAQLEIYPTSRWVSELQTTLWPRATQQPTLSRLTWAVIQGSARLATRLDRQHELVRLFGENKTHHKQRALAGRKLKAAQHLARQLRRLLLARPHWLQVWEHSHENLEDLATHEIPWPALWYEVSQVLGPVERHSNDGEENSPRWSDWLESLCKRAAQPSGPLSKKVRRIILFGHHRYDAQTLALARACSESIEVGLITIDPRACAPLNEQRRINHPETTRLIGVPLFEHLGQGFTAHHVPQAPLISSPSHDHTHQTTARVRSNLLPPPPFPVHLPTPQKICPLSPEQVHPKTLLHLFQADLSRDRDRPEAPHEVSSDVKSLRFHSSYSDQRQVEDLYQTLLGAFRRDPTLKPRDILVLCPDLERFSPLILAVFNGGVHDDFASESQLNRSKFESERAHRLGAEIARPHGHNPFASLLTHLIQLVGGRLYRYDVFELLKHPLVSARFSLSLSEILKLEQWTRESGVRWGMDDEHRIACGLGGEAHHTWTFGLDRLLIGTLMGGEEGLGPRSLYMGVAPLNIGGQAEEQLLSRFLDFFSQLKLCRSTLRVSHSPSEWCDHLIEALRNLTLASGSEAKALRQDVEADLYRVLKRGAPTQQALTPRAVQAMIEESVGKQRAVIGGGRDHVRFYPLDQAYSVPARVICFLNMSEGRFPNRHRPDPNDPLLLSPLPTDLDLLHEQNCNVLSSLLSAGEQVHFFYSGQRSGAEDKSPAPLVLAIQEELKSRYQMNEWVGDRLIEALTTRHPLHSFSVLNFIGNQEGEPTEETLSHEPLWLAGATAWRKALRDPHTPPSFTERGLDVATRGVSRPRIDTLRQLLKNPSEFFLKRGVGMHLVRDEELSRERELLELDHLQAWNLKERMFSLLKALDESKTLSEDEDDLSIAEIQLAESLTALDQLEATQGTELGETEVKNVKDWEKRAQTLMSFARAEGLLPVGRMGEVSFEQNMSEVRSLYERFDRVKGDSTAQPLTLTVELPSGRAVRVEGDKRYGDQLIFATPSNYQERLSDEQQGVRGDRIIEPWLYHVALSAAGVPYQGATLVARDGDFQGFPPLTMRRATELLEQWTDLLEDGALQPLRFDPGLSWRWASALARSESEAEAWVQLQESGSKWRRADDAYVRQAFGSQEMWATSISPSASSSSQTDESHSINQIDQLDTTSKELANIMGVTELNKEESEVPLSETQVHPKFVEHAQIIFGDLADALSVEISEEHGT